MGNQQNKKSKIYLCGQKDVGISTFLNCLHFLLFETQPSENQLLKDIQKTTQEFLDFCKTKNYSLDTFQLKTLEDYSTFYSSLKNLKYFEEFHKYTKVPEGIYLLLRYKDIIKYNIGMYLYIKHPNLKEISLTINNQVITFFKTSFSNVIKQKFTKEGGTVLFFQDSTKDFDQNILIDLNEVKLHQLCQVITKVDLYKNQYYQNLNTGEKYNIELDFASKFKQMKHIHIVLI